jgi:hypothetical protein
MEKALPPSHEEHKGLCREANPRGTKETNNLTIFLGASLVNLVTWWFAVLR